jgi:hypothetical protein
VATGSSPRSVVMLRHMMFTVRLRSRCDRRAVVATLVVTQELE